MNLIYLHGFASSPDSHKASAFRARCAELGHEIKTPDLNIPDFERLSLSAMVDCVEGLVASASGPVGLVGSSLGAYLSLVVAGRLSTIQAVVCLAPGVDLHRRWIERLGAEGLSAWKQRGTVSVSHYGFGADRDLHFGFFEELADYPVHPDPDGTPVLIYHGSQDEIIPLTMIEEYARDRDGVELRVVEDGHELRDSTDEVVAASLKFLERHCGPNRS